MTFGWIGYVWAMLGCGFVAGAFLATAAVLHVMGRRAEARGPRVTVEAVSVERGGPGATDGGEQA